MEEKEIREGNRILFDFMGCAHSKHEDMDRWEMSRLVYHNDWNPLLQVVEKIESIEDEKYGRFVVCISSNSCSIQSIKLHPFHLLPLYISDPNAILDTKIESTWYNVVKFIEFYNSVKSEKAPNQ